MEFRRNLEENLLQEDFVLKALERQQTLYFFIIFHSTKSRLSVHGGVQNFYGNFLSAAEQANRRFLRSTNRLVIFKFYFIIFRAAR